MSFGSTDSFAQPKARIKKSAICPKWSRQVSSESLTNSSYLTSTEVVAPESINDKVFTDEIQNTQLRQDLESRMIRNEQNKNYGTVENIESKQQDQEMQGFAKGVVNQVTKSSLKANLKGIKRNAENAFSGAKEPVAAAFLLATVYTGKAFRFKIGDQLKVESRASVRDKEASVGLAMPAGWNTAVKYAAHGDQNGVNAQLSKQINDNISAVADTASKGSFKLVYGVSF